MKVNKYDTLPVVYCSECLSLGVKEVEGYDVCTQCSNDTFKEAATIFDWEELFEDKYDESYLEW